MPRPRSFRGAIALLVLLTACHDIVDPPLPSGSERFAPPPLYARWWAMVEACSGITRPMSGVEWYVVPGESAKPGELGVTSYWSPASNRIVLGSAWLRNGAVVRHEMLHALVRVQGHRRIDFLERCGGVVTCAQACEADAGPIPATDPATPRVPASALELQMAIEPTVPGMAHDSGYFLVTVTARNPASHSVVVGLSPDPDRAGLNGFRLRVDWTSGSRTFWRSVRDSAITRFAAGETKRHLFDLWVDRAGLSGIPAGVHTFTATFGGHALRREQVVIGP